MRPTSIIWFERINIFGLVLAISTEILLWDQSRSVAAEEGVQVAMVPSLLAASYGLWLLLTLAVSRWRSNLFRWIYAAISVLGLVGVALMLTGAADTQSTPVDTVILLTQCGLDVAALVFLYRRDSTAWLAGRDPVDPEIFR
jgi:hypothetical protein